MQSHCTADIVGKSRLYSSIRCEWPKAENKIRPLFAFFHPDFARAISWPFDPQLRMVPSQAMLGFEEPIMYERKGLRAIDHGLLVGHWGQISLVMHSLEFHWYGSSSGSTWIIYDLSCFVMIEVVVLGEISCIFLMFGHRRTHTAAERVPTFIDSSNWLMKFILLIEYLRYTPSHVCKHHGWPFTTKSGSEEYVVH